MRSIRDFKFLFEIRTSNVCLRMNNKIAASQMMTCGYFVWSVSVVPLGSLHVPMGRSTSAHPVLTTGGKGAYISLIAACAAARRAMGTRKGEQDT